MRNPIVDLFERIGDWIVPNSFEWKYDEMSEAISQINEKALMADGFEKALIGYVERFDMEPVALYNRDKCIEILMKDMTADEAEEYFQFNVSGAWMGEGTPAFAVLLGDNKWTG